MCVHVCVLWVCVCINIARHMYICTYIYMYVYIYIYNILFLIFVHTHIRMLPMAYALNLMILVRWTIWICLEINVYAFDVHIHSCLCVCVHVCALKIICNMRSRSIQRMGVHLFSFDAPNHNLELLNRLDVFRLYAQRAPESLTVRNHLLRAPPPEGWTLAPAVDNGLHGTQRLKLFTV